MADVRGVYFGPDLFSSDNQFLNVLALDGVVSTTPARQSSFVELAPDAERVFELGIAAGDKTDRPSPTLREGRGVLIDGFGDGVLFNEVYVEIVDLSESPNIHYGIQHDVGFITEDITLNILIWNAYLSSSKTWTALNVVDEDGTALTYPTLPQVITPGGEIQCDLTIYLSGPARQDTDHEFTIGGEVYTTTITGIRVISIAPEPNWRTGIEVKYEYQTAMYQTSRFVEQRRALVDVPFRASMLEYLMVGAVARKFFHNLSYGHDKVFGVPIYSELMVPIAVPQGDVTITLSTATASMWNLNNLCDYIAVVDHENDMVEIKEISSIGANSIVCSQDILQDFTVASTRIYPVFFGMVRAATLNQETDGIDSVKLDFMEFSNGG